MDGGRGQLRERVSIASPSSLDQISPHALVPRSRPDGPVSH
jgi:hypothetical protein